MGVVWRYPIHVSGWAPAIPRSASDRSAAAARTRSVGEPVDDAVEGSFHVSKVQLSLRQLDLGVGFVPEDRTEDGLVAEFTIAENLMLDRSDRKPFAKGISLQLEVLKKFAEEKLKQFDIRAQGITSKASELSGGNQQKVVLARELSRELSLFVASQPTRGLDVGSIEFVHEQIVATRDRGIPVLIVATELDEATQLGDRIAVMYKGKIVGIVPSSTPRATLGQMMAGISA